MTEETIDDVRRSMRLAALVLILLWAIFGVFIAWVCMSLVYPDVPPVLAFLEACIIYVVVSVSLALTVSVMMEDVP